LTGEERRREGKRDRNRKATTKIEHKKRLKPRKQKEFENKLH
jgi:hypothetical protein